jgi:hypothetical protein
VPSCTGNSSLTSACNGNGACTTSSVSCPFGCRSGANTCAQCRQKNGNNLLFNPGLDGSREGWTLGGGNAYSTADVENCSASGSILMTDFTNEMSQCQNLPGSGTYLLGFRFRSQRPGDSGYCDLAFHPGLDCTGDAIFDPNGTPAQVTPAGSSWGAAMGSASAPANAASVRMFCIAAIGFGNYDQLYLSRTTIGF